MIGEPHWVHRLLYLHDRRGGRVEPILLKALPRRGPGDAWLTGGEFLLSEIQISEQVGVKAVEESCRRGEFLKFEGSRRSCTGCRLLLAKVGRDQRDVQSSLLGLEVGSGRLWRTQFFELRGLIGFFLSKSEGYGFPDVLGQVAAAQ